MDRAAARRQPALRRHLAGSGEVAARPLYEEVYCARGEMENRIKEWQLDLFADRTCAETMRANQLIPACIDQDAWAHAR